MADVLISAVQPVDVEEILTLQCAAYVTEAQLYNDVSLPPLALTIAGPQAPGAAG